MIGDEIYFAQWDITGRCNLECAFCRQSLTQGFPDELKPVDFKKILNQFPEMKIRHLSVAGGEPLLFPDLEWFLAYASRRVGAISLLSNGTLIGEREAINLKKYLDHAQISLDAACAEVHDKIRGKGSFERAQRGIKNLLRVGVKTFVRITVYRENIDQIIPLMYWCKENGVSQFVCRRVVGVGKGSNVNTLSAIELKQILFKVADIGKQLGLPVEFGDPFPDLFVKKSRREEADQDEEILSGIKAGGCSVGLSAIYITQNGFVCLCPYLPIYCGNLKNQTIREIWQGSETYRLIRSLRYNLQGKCGSCKYRFACGGCRAVAYYATGNICAEDSGCWYGEND